jgi:hypothetical protein
MHWSTSELLGADTDSRAWRSRLMRASSASMFWCVVMLIVRPVEKSVRQLSLRISA